VAYKRTELRQPAASDEIRVEIVSDPDIVTARQKGRELAQHMGFQFTDLTLIAAVVSELARNIILYAKRGEIVVQPLHPANGQGPGITVIARDDGPGIWNIDQAMQVGYSTSGGLGLGLPGVKRLMDEFEIKSRVGGGTVVTARKWKR
jgi:serine/threonine-protein kinase RsbT